MTDFITSLRADINRDRAYVRSIQVNIEKGFHVSPMTKIHASIRHHNAAIIRRTLRALKKIKINYKWLPRN